MKTTITLFILLLTIGNLTACKIKPGAVIDYVKDHVDCEYDLEEKTVGCKAV